VEAKVMEAVGTETAEVTMAVAMMEAVVAAMPVVSAAVGVP
jgi:hypothetical protein